MNNMINKAETFEKAIHTKRFAGQLTDGTLIRIWASKDGKIRIAEYMEFDDPSYGILLLSYDHNKMSIKEKNGNIVLKTTESANTSRDCIISRESYEKAKVECINDEYITFEHTAFTPFDLNNMDPNDLEISEAEIKIENKTFEKASAPILN